PGACDPLHRFGVHVLHENVAVEANAEVREIADAERRVEVLIVGDEQRVEPEAFLHEMDDEIAVVRAGHRHDAVVIVARAAAVGLDDGFELAPALGPVEPVLLLMYAAARANPFRVEREAERMRRAVEAAPAEADVAHEIASGRS